MSPHRFLLRVSVAALLCGGLVSSAAAMPVNPGFESGLASWNVEGDAVAVPGAVLGFAPREGAAQLLLTTVVAASDPFGPSSGVDASDAATIAGILGSGPITSSGGVAGREGSVVWQDVTFTDAGRLTIDWNLLSMETGLATSDDFVFFALVGLSETSPMSISTADLGPTPNPAIAATGWKRSGIDVPAAGSYRLAVGVFDGEDDQGPSALLVDDMRFVNPEPGTGTLVGVGLVGLGVAGRRRRLREPRA